MSVSKKLPKPSSIFAKVLNAPTITSESVKDVIIDSHATATSFIAASIPSK